MSKRQDKSKKLIPFHHTGPLDIRLMKVAMSDIRDCFEMLPGDEHITRDHLLEIMEQRIDLLKHFITKSRGEVANEDQ
jgi:hypothetical protein